MPRVKNFLEQVAPTSWGERQTIRCPPAGDLIRHNLQIQTNKTPGKATLLLKLTNYSPRTDIKTQLGGYFIARADKLIAGLEGRFNAGKKKNDPRHKSCELGH